MKCSSIGLCGAMRFGIFVCLGATFALAGCARADAPTAVPGKAATPAGTASPNTGVSGDIRLPGDNAMQPGHDGPEMAAPGARFIHVASGTGVLATGIATYREMENPVATRMAKRQAYMAAYTESRKNMAEFLHGLNTAGKASLRETFSTVVTPKENLANTTAESEEIVRQTVEMILRGFVIYEVRDNPATHSASVSIIATPKTLGQLTRVAANAVESKDLQAGIDAVSREVRTGLVPPMGGRIVMVPSTGEMAFVAFGSTVVQVNANDAAQERLNLLAARVAQQRAKDSLCGLLIGDKITWQGQIAASQKDAIEDFADLPPDDPAFKTSDTGVKKLEVQRQTFVAKMQTTDTYQTARSGTLPPGLAVDTWYDSDNAFAYAMVIYAPSMSKAAASIADGMSHARLVEPIGHTDANVSPATGEGFRDTQGTGVPHPGTPIRQGPTGKVMQDDDL